MLTLLHRFAEKPRIYDLIQFFFGGRIVYRRLQKLIQKFPLGNFVVDIGGGTGLFYRKIIEPVEGQRHQNYICLDMDVVKLEGFRQVLSDKQGILGDASRLPFKDCSIDQTILMAVTHHIPDALVNAVIQESLRVLKEDGHLIFLDAVNVPNRLLSRIMWSLDRGHFAHTERDLLTALNKYGQVLVCEQYSIVHRYLLCIVKRNLNGATSNQFSPQ